MEARMIQLRNSLKKKQFASDRKVPVYSEQSPQYEQQIGFQ